MIEGLKRALKLIENEIIVTKEFKVPQRIEGMNQIKIIIQDELDAEEHK